MEKAAFAAFFIAPWQLASSRQDMFAPIKTRLG
jgi:hypothetical protein